MAIVEKDRAAATPGGDAAELSTVLLAALQALADAGEVDRACRLAGRACAALRGRDAGQWRRFNVLLHRLGPRAGPVGRQDA